MQPVILGRIHGLFGVRGWVKVYSYTQPPENILDFPLWHLGTESGWVPMHVVAGRVQGRGLVAHLAPEAAEPLADRDAAAALLEADIAVDRDQLPVPAEDEVYWVDLIGCTVTTVADRVLGPVADVSDNGAHPILVIAGDSEHLVPLVRGPIVRDIDLEARRITVDWDPDF